MPVACTYQYGRSLAATVETGSPAREAGQFSEYLSCAVRGGDLLQIPVGTMLTATRGALIVYFDPDLAYNDGSLGASGRVFQIGTGSDAVIGLYDKADARFEVTRGSGAAAVAASAFTAGQALAVLFAWDATLLHCAVNAGAIDTEANTNTGITLGSAVHLGTDDAAGNAFAIAAGAVAFLEGPPTAAQWEVLAGLRASRPPAYGEGGTGASMTGLWYGADTRVLRATDAIDLNDIRGDRVMLQALRGTGIAPVQHRTVATPLRDGSVYVDTKVVPRRLVAEMVVVSRTDFAAIWDLRRDLVRRLNPRRGQGILTYAPSARLYEVDAIVDQGGAAFDESLGPFAMTPRIPFVCDDPAWRDVVVAATLEETSGEGAVVPFDFPLDFFPGERFTVENEGDLPVWPVVTIEGPVVGPFITNVTSGQTFRLRDSVSLVVGQSVVIDMDARTVLRDDGENLMPGRAADAEMWALEPGDNVLEAGFASAASVPVSFTVEHAPRFVGM